MKKVKGLLRIFAIIVIAVTIMQSPNYAANIDQYLMMYNKSYDRRSGEYQTIGKAGSGYLRAFKIMETTNQEGTTQGNYNNSIYCIKGGIGFGEGNTDQVPHYEKDFNMRKPSGGDGDESFIGTAYDKWNISTQSDNYKKLMWVLDHMFITDETDVNTIAQKMNEYLNNTTQNPIPIRTETNPIGLTPEQLIDVVESAQQAAIWHFANPGNESDEDINKFHGPDDPEQFQIVKKVGGGYTDDFYNAILPEDPAKSLFKYLVNSANSDTSYDYTNAGGATLSPTKGFSACTTHATSSYNSSLGRYIIGPYEITKNGSGNVENLAVSFKDGNNDISNVVKIVDAQGTEIQASTLEGKIIGREFYVSVPTTVQNFKFNVSASSNTRTIRYWAPKQNDVLVVQPVAKVKKQSTTFNADSEVTPQPPALDLALRKYITKVSDATGTEKTGISNIQRKPNVDESTISSQETTATYKHRKDPVKVETGDIVTYKIRIYNEGEVAGRATQITDQLPDGVSMTTSTGSVTSKKGNTYTFQTDSENKVTFTTSGTTNIPAYSSNSLQDNGAGYDEITFDCKVDKENREATNLVLTNIAWISAQRREGASADEASDRDSQPGAHPNVDKNSSSYRGKSGDTTDLAESDHFFKGEQDDDDFEKLVIEPREEEKPLDLALRKYITKIVPANGTEKNNIRTVQVNEANLKNLTDSTAEYKHSKNAIEVSKGDTIFYNIRIYNEGEVVGRATEITDQLPAGLTFKEVVSGNFELASSQPSSDTNKIVLVRKTSADSYLPAYHEGSLQEGGDGYETITVKCEVSNDAESEKELTNIAWISKQQKEGGEEVTVDRDSQPGTHPNVDKNSYSYRGRDTQHNLEDSDYFFEGQEDDDDFEKVKIIKKKFDLALRKFITKIAPAAGGTAKTYDDRIPRIDIEEREKLANGTARFGGTTAEKDHSKDPLEVSEGDIVTYTIKIYNEGDIDGYATTITDYLPAGLEFIPASESTINSQYGWSYDSATRKVTTNKLQDTKINAFNKATKELSSESVEIQCKVTNGNAQNLRNIAAITAHRNSDNLDDVDSEPQEINPNSYNPQDGPHGMGEQDDDDYEDLKPVKFDLALRKFITGIYHVKDPDHMESITNREPSVDTSRYDGVNVTTFTYNHTKDPVRVEQNEIVEYTIRVYNEGSKDGYAEIIKDDIPEGLEFLPDHPTNNSNGYNWKMLDESGNQTTDAKKAKFITTDYRSKQNGEENLLKAYTSDMQNNPSSVDVKVAFKVTMPNTSDRIVINQAQISKHTDKDGNAVKDIDSTPDEWIEGEDDQDIEKIYVKYFDLALRKWVTHAIVIEDGVQKEMATGHKAEDNEEDVVKVELNKKRLESTVVKFRYSIRITNEGEIAGYATEISDYIPQGLKFNQADNPKWREVEGKIVTDQLKDTLLEPGQSTEIEVLLTWENDEKNMGHKLVNVAEISEDKNDSDTPDIDSVPNNKKEGEDDIDDAPVILVAAAGSAPAYFAIAGGVVFVIVASAALIKKYVI